MIDTTKTLADLIAERDKFSAAILALQVLNGVEQKVVRPRGRPFGSPNKPKVPVEITSDKSAA